MERMNEIFRKPDCPFGKKAIALLHEKGIAFEDRVFANKDEELALKTRLGVKTTPQIFLAGERVGGYTDLAARFGVAPEKPAEKKKSYVPVMAVFATAGLMAWATSTGLNGFMGLSLCVLALLKLMDLSAFAKTFANYDLISLKLPTYANAYPFLELAAGLGFLSMVAPTATGALSLFVGVAGGISIVKAVFIDKRDLACGCVGGNSNVPLGIVSFTENAVMAGMGLYVLLA